MVLFGCGLEGGMQACRHGGTYLFLARREPWSLTALVFDVKRRGGKRPAVTQSIMQVFDRVQCRMIDTIFATEANNKCMPD